LKALINLKHNPFLIRLKKKEEELSDLLNLPPEKFLLSWFNYHLAKTNYGMHVTNFGIDV
jgi:plastin-1